MLLIVQRTNAQAGNRESDDPCAMLLLGAGGTVGGGAHRGGVSVLAVSGRTMGPVGLGGWLGSSSPLGWRAGRWHAFPSSSSSATGSCDASFRPSLHVRTVTVDGQKLGGMGGRMDDGSARILRPGGAALVLQPLGIPSGQTECAALAQEFRWVHFDLASNEGRNSTQPCRGEGEEGVPRQAPTAAGRDAACSMMRQAHCIAFDRISAQTCSDHPAQWPVVPPARKPSPSAAAQLVRCHWS